MKFKAKVIGWMFLLICLIVINGCEKRPPPGVVSQVDLNRYMGVWYEIASIPSRFQKGCVCTRVEYLMKKNYISVINRCWRKRKWDVVKGKGFEVKGSNGSKLKVQLFWPFKGDYWILWLAKDYKTVLVGSPNYKHLWILSKEKHIDKKNYKKIEKIAKEKGYDVRQLVKTQCNHKKGKKK